MVLSIQGIEKYAREGTNDYQEPLREPRTISGVFYKYRSPIKLESFTTEKPEESQEVATT